MISLIVATKDRVAELERLLASLMAQSYREFEVIIVDQNPDDRLAPVLERAANLAIKHLRCAPGVSLARNLGIRVAHGELIAFPDDDCWYPPDLLASVRAWFAEHPEFAVLLTATRDQHGQVMAPKFPLKRGACTKTSILRCAVTFNAFFRAEAVRAIGFFREDIGPGTSSPYQSSEDIDYLIRPIEHGFAAWHETDLTVYHPNFKSRERLLQKIYPYSLGLGHVLRSHNYPWWVIGEAALRSLCGAALHLCKFDWEGARLYGLRAKGQLQGYFGKQHAPTGP